MTIDAADTPVLPLHAGDDERAIRESVRGICAQFGPRYGREQWDAGLPPTELNRALAEAGFLGICIPEEYGGGGMGLRGLSIVAEEVAQSMHFISLAFVVNAAIAGVIIAKHGTPEQRERWLPAAAKGDFTFAFAITEPDAGSNSHSLRTTIRRRGDTYVLSGQKYYISGVEDADAVLVVARLRDADGEARLPTLCIVAPDAPGFTRDEIPMPYLGPDRQWTLYFDDVEVSPDDVVGGENSGLRALFDGLNPERIIGAASLIGMGAAALEQGAAYACERAVWKAPIGSHQGIAHPLAEAKIELELARLMTQKAAALYDADSPATGETANMAKYAAAEAAIHCVDTAIQTHGGNGLALEYGLSDMYWTARLARIAPVSREMILNHVAEHSLGLPKSY